MPCLPTSRRLHLKMRCFTHFLSKISFHLLSACDLTGTPFPPCRHQSHQHRDCSEYVRALVFNSMLEKFLERSRGRFVSRYLSKGISQHARDFCEHRPSRDLHNYPRSFGYHSNTWYFFLPHTPRKIKYFHRCAVFAAVLSAVTPAGEPGAPSCSSRRPCSWKAQSRSRGQSQQSSE